MSEDSSERFDHKPMNDVMLVTGLCVYVMSVWHRMMHCLCLTHS